MAKELGTLPAAELALVHTVVHNVAREFGYQGFNKRPGESEEWVSATEKLAADHLVALIEPLFTRLDDKWVTAVGTLHRDVFTPYQHWLDHVGLKWTSLKIRPNTKGAQDASASLAGATNHGVQRDPPPSPHQIQTAHCQVYELALWLLLYTEASNLRHTPELLWYLFYVLRKSKAFEKLVEHFTGPELSADFMAGSAEEWGRIYRHTGEHWRALELGEDQFSARLALRNKFANFIHELRRPERLIGHPDLRGFMPYEQLGGSAEHMPVDLTLARISNPLTRRIFTVLVEDYKKTIDQDASGQDAMLGWLEVLADCALENSGPGSMIYQMFMELVLYGDGGLFLDKVIQPVFLVLAEQVRTLGGVGEDPALRVAYDDCNESMCIPNIVKAVDKSGFVSSWDRLLTLDEYMRDTSWSSMVMYPRNIVSQYYEQALLRGLDKPQEAKMVNSYRAAHYWISEVFCKTYVEKRSASKIFLAFFRVYAFHILQFHILAALCWTPGQSWAVKVYYASSAIITQLVLACLESVVAIYQAWGLKVSRKQEKFRRKQAEGREEEDASTRKAYRLPCRELPHPRWSWVMLWLLLLLRVALLVALIVFYTAPVSLPLSDVFEAWLAKLGVRSSRNTWAAVGGGYMGVYLLYETVRNLPCGHVWWPGVTDLFFRNRDLDCYFSRGYLRSSVGKYWINNIMWLAILALKVLFEWMLLMDVYPKLRDIWTTDSEGSYKYIRFEAGRDAVNVVLSVALVLPYLLLSMFDSGLFYQLVSASLGSIYGYMRLRLGHVRNWKLLVAGFTRVPEQWWDKGMSETARVTWNKTHDAPTLVREDHEGGLFVQPWESRRIERTRTLPRLLPSPKGGEVKVHIQDEVGDPWGAFESVWREIVEELRERDLLSDKEKNALMFVQINHHLKAVQEVDKKEQLKAETSRFARPSVLLPRFMCCGQIRQLVDMPKDPNDHQDAVLTTAARALLWVVSQGGYITADDAQFLMDLRVRDLRSRKKLLDEVLNLLKCLKMNLKGYSPVASMVLPGKAALVHFKTVTKAVFGALFKIANLLQDEKQHLDMEAGPKGAARTHIIRLRNQFETLFEEANKWKITDTTTAPPEALSPVRRHHRMTVNTWRASAIQEVVAWLQDVLTKNEGDMEPAIEEAKESLQWFATTLYNPHLKHKNLATVKNMLTVTTLTPHYAEDVIYGLSLNDVRQTLGPGAKSGGSEHDKSFLFLNSGEANDQSKYWKYLKTVYPKEWGNFLERIKGLIQKEHPNKVLPEKLDESHFLPGGVLHDQRHHLLLWASNRGQLLSRTARGMMLYARALKVLAKMELGPYSTDNLEKLVDRRYNYIVASQVHGDNLAGKQEVRGQWVAYGVNFLLGMFPKMKVAYIDSVEPVKMTFADFDFKIKEQYSVLIQADPKLLPASISFDTPIATKELYRVRLPINYEDSLRVPDTYHGARGIILGEGKPENQNHAVIFCHGELLQTIDMNQDNHLAEAFKIKNLAQEFTRKAKEGPSFADRVKKVFQGKPAPQDPGLYTPVHYPPRHEVALLGFRERIFSADSGATAQFAAATELTFGSAVQRMMSKPGAVRFHYGHPDVWNKKFIMTRGGVSKANCQLHVSEDVFGGYNAALRGGEIKYVEYITVGKGRDMGFDSINGFEAKVAAGNGEQVMSREIYRLGTRMDFFRLMSWYVTGNGFFINNFLSMFSIYLNVWVTLLLSLADRTSALNLASFGAVQILQMGSLSVLVFWFSKWLESGLLNAIGTLFQQFLAGSFLFHSFRANTSAQFFSRDVIFGGAGYIATGRGYTLEPNPFTTMFMNYGRTHLYFGMELMLLLVMVAVVAPFHISLQLWASWLVVVALLIGPFWFNPFAFDTSRLQADMSQFARWMGDHVACGKPAKTWSGWNKDNLAKPRNDNRLQTGRTWTSLFNILAQVPTLLLALTAVDAIEVRKLHISPWIVFLLVSGMVWLLAVLGLAGKYYYRKKRLSTGFRGLKDVAVILGLVCFLVFIIFFGSSAHRVKNGVIILYTNFQLAKFVVSSMLYLPFVQRQLGMRRLVDAGFWLADCALGYFLLSVLFIMSPLGLVTKIQGVLLFNTDFARQVVAEEAYRGTEPERQLRLTIDKTEKILQQLEVDKKQKQ